VLVYLPQDYQPPSFYVLSCARLMQRREEYQQRLLPQSRNYRDELGGINWSTALEYEDCWDSLPA
jgi:hypothetical protein